MGKGIHQIHEELVELLVLDDSLLHDVVDQLLEYPSFGSLSVPHIHFLEPFNQCLVAVVSLNSS